MHAHPHNVDGLLWVSRQRDTSRALVLFGDRVKVDDLEVAPEVPLTLGAGPGLEAVSAAASHAYQAAVDDLVHESGLAA